MKAFLNSFMSWLGYVPVPATSVSTIKIEVNVDSESVDAAVARLGQLQAVADVAEAALGSIAALEKFAATEPATDIERDKLFCEMRALVWEIRQERAERVADMRKRNSGTDASGLPG